MPIDRTAAIAAIQNLPETRDTASAPTAGYYIHDLRYGLNCKLGEPAQIPRLGAGAEVIVAPTRGLVTVDAIGNARYTASAKGREQIQFRNAAGKVTLVDMYVI